MKKRRISKRSKKMKERRSPTRNHSDSLGDIFYDSKRYVLAQGFAKINMSDFIMDCRAFYSEDPNPIIPTVRNGAFIDERVRMLYQVHLDNRINEIVGEILRESTQKGYFDSVLGTYKVHSIPHHVCARCNFFVLMDRKGFYE